MIFQVMCIDYLKKKTQKLCVLIKIVFSFCELLITSLNFNSYYLSENTSNKGIMNEGEALDLKIVRIYERSLLLLHLYESWW